MQRLLTSYWGTAAFVALIGVVTLVLFDDPPSSSLPLKVAVLVLGAVMGTTVGYRLSLRYAVGRRFSRSSVVHFTVAVAAGFVTLGIVATLNGQTWPLVAWAIPGGAIAAVGSAVAREGSRNAS